MRIVLVTQDEPFFMPSYIQGLVVGNPDVCAVVVLPAFSSVRRKIRKSFDFLGPWWFLWQGMRIVGFKGRDLVAPLLGLRRRHSVAGIARENSVPCACFHAINAPAAREYLRAARPDVIFSIAAPQKFGPEVLAIPRWGCFNVHSSLLPKFPGQNAIFWAMLYGEKQAGFTIHQMDDRLDTGPVAYQQAVPIRAADTYEDVCRRVMAEAIPQIRSFWESLRANNGGFVARAGTAAQDDATCRFFHFPGREDRRAFRRAGRRLFHFVVG